MNRQEVTSSDKILSLHCQLLELLLHEWEERSDVGSDHTPELQQQLFAGVSAEDPHLLAELCVAHSNQAQAAGGGAATPTEQTRMRIQGYADVLQVRKKIYVSVSYILWYKKLCFGLVSRGMKIIKNSEYGQLVCMNQYVLLTVARK